MSSNKLKIIAVISMLIDHIGYLLFPDIIILRYFGRIALPIFAFFIAEGCFYTRNKIKYFLQVFVLAVICQTFYIANDLLNGGIKSIYLNVLFTFSLSIIVVSAYINILKTAKQKDNKKTIVAVSLFILSLLFVCFLQTALTPIFNIEITIDYGVAGILLPLFAALFKDKNKRFISFSIGTIIYCVVRFSYQPYVFFSLLALPLIFLYNGQRGRKNLKWFFYLFYPLHFAVIYGISLLK